MNRTLLNFGFTWFKDKSPKVILFTIIYLVIRRINQLNEKWRFLVAKNINRYIKIADMQNYTIDVNGSKMIIDFDDEGLSQQLYLHRIRERYSTEYMKKIVKEDDIIIDIGANVGYYALLESRLAHKGHVYAIEPVLNNIWCLRRNIKLNDYKNISTHSFAMGDKIGRKKIYVYEKANLCSFTKNIQHKSMGHKVVRIATVDAFVDFISEHPTLIRMDVEGYEYQIIKGMTNILRENKPLILFIELHPFMVEERDMDELLATLRQNNFKVKAIFCEPATSDYGKEGVLNKIFSVLGVPKYGYIGKGYNKLKWALKKRGFTATMAFFERI